MKKIAVFVATYNHPDVVNDVLEKCTKDYKECGIDIYYYDSSEGNETELVVKKYQDVGFDNIYYLKISSEMRLKEKLYMIFSGYGQKEGYDYIWPVKDRVYCPKITLENILEAAEEGYDSIFLGIMNTANGIQIGTTTYENPVEFYRDWGWLTTSLDVVIYNSKSMLDGFDEITFKKQYAEEYNASHFAYVYFLNQIANIDNLKIRLLRDGRTGIYNSPLGKSMWRKSTFLVWQEYWIKANLDLPECYNQYKPKVIKETASLPWILGSISSLIELRDMGVLSLESYEVIKEDWKMISDIPLETVHAIICGTYDVLHDVNLLSKSDDEMIRLLIRCIDMIEKDILPKESIPIDSIEEYISNKLIEKKQITQEEYYIFKGSLYDIKSIMLNESRSKKDIVCVMQMYISIVLLIGK